MGVDGEEGLAVGFGAEGADLGVEGAAEVVEGAGLVEAVEGVEVEGDGGDVAAVALGGDAECAEFGPGFDGCGEDGVAVSCGCGVVAQGVGPDFGLFDVPVSGCPAGGAEGGVDGDGEAGWGSPRSSGAETGGGGAVGVHVLFVCRGCGVVRGVQPVVGSTVRTPKWAVRAVQARQGAA